jgi:hypothetical protein
MSNPIDNETYGRPASDAPDNVQHGNPGKPQSDYQFDDVEPDPDPRDFRSGTGEVVPGTVAKTEGTDDD